ncbi:MAG: branched-chain amino acid transaminase [Anaerolineae bacterium]|nr:MAG: branched-chain amino acid transaminase [Anaerolineae bacterium]
MTRFAFFQGEIVPIEQAKISVMTHGLHYGTACFAGIRGYWNAERANLYIFRIEDHFRRFLASSRMLLMDLPYTAADLVNITVDLVQREGYREDCYIRPLAYKSTAAIGVRLHNLDAAVTIFSIPFGKYIESETGAQAGTSTWRRVDDTAIPARGKLSGAYVNSALIKTEAMANGFDEAIVLNQDGHVSEGSAENILLVRDGQLISTPITANILEGITRRTLFELARAELGLEVIERDVDRSELYVADEIMFCGTGVQIVAVTSVDRRPVGAGTMGPVVGELRRLYFDAVRGNLSQYRHWCTPVYPEEL